MTMIVSPHTETQSLLRIQTFMFLFFPPPGAIQNHLSFFYEIFCSVVMTKLTQSSEKNLKNSSELDNYCNQIES